MREQLLGYLLGALDADEQAAVERQLSENPELVRELEFLRAQLLPLESNRMEYEPPGDLAARTCAQLDERAPASNDSTVAPVQYEYESFSHGNSFTMVEILLTAGVCAAMAILFFPAVLESRDHARRTFCQEGLRQLGEALTRFSLEHQDKIPKIPLDNKFGFAGIIPVKLQEAGFLVDPSILICPGSEFSRETTRFKIPTYDELSNASPHQFWNLKCRAGG